MRDISRLIFIILCFSCQTVTNLLYAQPVSFLEGKIMNSTTSEPVPFATIKLKNNLLSVYTNEEGDFRLILNPQFQSDSVEITCIGFKKYSISFKELNEGEVNMIHLIPSLSGMEKVKVTAPDGKFNSVAIIKRAIGNLNTRYPVKPFNYISYTRDYQKKDSNYINLNEAIIQMMDSGFISRSTSNRYRLLDFRKNMDFPRLNLAPVSSGYDSADFIHDELIPEDVIPDQYGIEILTLMSHDPIRNFNKRSFEFIETFSENFIDNHNFSPPSEVFDDNLPLFKITFNGKTRITGDSLLVSGAIYINPEDYSIHKLEYCCYNKTKDKGLKKVFDFDMEYGYNNKSDSMMSPRYISFSRLFNVIDLNDISYFRLIDTRWDDIRNLNPTLALRFNNKVDPVTASQKENYLIRLGKNEININKVQIAGENIFIRFKGDNVKDITDSCELFFRGVLKDINGNILDKRKSMEIYQYRELFVQEFHKTITLQDSSIMQYLTRGRDTTSLKRRKEKYWMNTPENNLKLSPDKSLQGH